MPVYRELANFNQKHFISHMHVIKEISTSIVRKSDSSGLWWCLPQLNTMSKHNKEVRNNESSYDSWLFTCYHFLYPSSKCLGFIPKHLKLRALLNCPETFCQFIRKVIATKSRVKHNMLSNNVFAELTEPQFYQPLNFRNQQSRKSRVTGFFGQLWQQMEFTSLDH